MTRRERVELSVYTAAWFVIAGVAFAVSYRLINRKFAA